jgi:hypothetical protein
MKRATRKPQPSRRPSRGETKFPGIKRHAETLGVSRPHLFMVLTGQRKSVSLTGKYRALIAAERHPKAA